MSNTNTTVNASMSGSWRLGDLTVNRIGFGAMRLTGSAAFDLGTQSNRDTAIAVLRRAVELGVNHIDTAAFYFSRLRSANELINTALSPYAEELVIATKVGPGRDPSGEWYTATPEQLRGQVEENLRQLGRDHLDLVNLRRMPSQSTIGEHFSALAELRSAGLIRHLGVSNVTLDQLAETQAIAPVVCVQNQFNIDDRAHGDVLKRCRELGIAFVPYFAIAGDGGARGAAARPDESQAITAIAKAHDATPAQVRLAWTLQQGPHVLAIPGTGNPAHLEENIAAGALRLTNEELDTLT